MSAYADESQMHCDVVCEYIPSIVTKHLIEGVNEKVKLPTEMENGTFFFSLSLLFRFKSITHTHTHTQLINQSYIYIYSTYGTNRSNLDYGTGSQRSCQDGRISRSDERIAFGKTERSILV